MDIEKEKSAFQQWYDQYRLESLRRGYGPDATLEQHPHWSTGFEDHMKLAWMARAAIQTPTPPSQPSDKPFPHEDIQHLLPSAETGCFTDALKESSNVREQRMARGTLPKD